MLFDVHFQRPFLAVCLLPKESQPSKWERKRLRIRLQAAKLNFNDCNSPIDAVFACPWLAARVVESTESTYLAWNSTCVPGGGSAKTSNSSTLSAELMANEWPMNQGCAQWINKEDHSNHLKCVEQVSSLAKEIQQQYTEEWLGRNIFI